MKKKKLYYLDLKFVNLSFLKNFLSNKNKNNYVFISSNIEVKNYLSRQNYKCFILKNNNNIWFNFCKFYYYFNNTEASITHKKNVFTFKIENILMILLSSLINFFYLKKLVSIIKNQIKFNNLFYSKLKKFNFDEIFLLCGSYNLSVMKILNFAKTNNIKSHLSLSNWDTLTTKSPILTMPDTLGLFGKSSQKHFKMLKYLDDHCRVILEGPNYLKFLYKNVNKKQKYLKKNVVIFAESIRSKYTFNLLLVIENLVEKNFKNKIKILFKPHPLRKFNYNEINFYNQKFKNIFIPNKLKKNYLISLKRQLNDKDLNPSYLDSSLYLKNSIGVISQPSTFLLDSAVNNIIPFLICLGGIKNQMYLISKDYYIKDFIDKKLCYTHSSTHNIEIKLFDYFLKCLNKKNICNKKNLRKLNDIIIFQKK